MSQEYGVLTDQFPAKIEWGAGEIPSLTGEIKGALEAGPNMGYLMSKTLKIQKQHGKLLISSLAMSLLKTILKQV